MPEQPGLGFGGLLRQLRTEARLTQEELAAAASLSPRSVSDLERGVNRTARKETAELLAVALGLAGSAQAAFVAAARGRTVAAEALTVIQAGADSTLARAEGLWVGCPYLGLTPFREQDATVFYGRGDLVSQLVDRLAERLGQPGVLLVTGESGAGKSSLLAAGLVPRLAAGALGPGSDRWPRRLIRPAARPLRELARELAGVADTDPESVYRSLTAAPGEAPVLVELAVRTAVGRGASPTRDEPGGAPPAAPRLILIIDQFEELFTAAETEADRAEREAFVAALHAVATVPAGPRGLPSALVIIAVRADFLGRLIAYPPLKAALDAGPFTVGPMSEADLRTAMTGPAAEAGLVVAAAVTDAVIAELREGTWGGAGSGVLPLMSQAMAATWESREGTELTLRGYRRAGGVADSVNRTAQAAYISLSPRLQDAARLVFTQLTTVTLDGQFERRRCRRADLSAPGVPQAEMDTVIDVFSARRLLVLGHDSVEISHDVLLQAWKQLRDWLGDDQLDRALYGQVVSDARAWDASGRDPAYLYRPGRLTAIAAAVARWENAPARYPPLPATGQAFLRAGQHAARRSARQRRSAFVVMAVLTVLALVASAVAFDQRSAAVHQRDQAVYNQLVAESLQFGSSDTTLAAQLDLAAYRIRPTQDLAARLLDTENAPLASTLAAGGGSVTAVVFDPAGHLLARGSSDGTVQLWDVSAIAPPLPLGPPLSSGPGEGLVGGPSGVLSVAFSPDGRVLANGNSDGTVNLWDVGDPVHPKPFGRLVPGGQASSVAFSPDGHLLAVAGASGTDPFGAVQLWNIADPARPVPLGLAQPDQPGVSVKSVAFDPGGRVLAVGYFDGTVRLWDVADPSRPRLFGPSLTRATLAASVAFSPDGRTLASGDEDGAIQLWNVADPARPRLLGPGQAGLGVISSVAFSPDGRTLASANLDGRVYLWGVASPAQLSPLDQPFSAGTSAVYSVAFSPDGQTLASGSLDGSLRLWSLPQTVLVGGTPGPDQVAFSRTGHILVSSDGSGAVRLWSVADSAHPRPLGPGLPRADTAGVVAFSADGQMLASGDGGAVQLWDVADPARPRPLGLIRVGGTSVSSVAFSPDGRTLVSGNTDDTVRLWDITKPDHPRPVGPVMTGGTGGSVQAVTFSASRHVLASGSSDGTIQLWNVADPGEPKPMGVNIVANGAVPFSLTFSPDGRMLASGGSGGTIQLWSLADPAFLRPLGLPHEGGGDEILAVAFSADGRTLASGSDDGTTRLWTVVDPADLQLLGPPLTGSGIPVDSVAFSADGRLLASGSDDGTTRLWSLGMAYAIRHICAAAGGLSPRQWRQYIPQLPYQASCPG